MHRTTTTPPHPTTAGSAAEPPTPSSPALMPALLPPAGTLPTVEEMDAFERETEKAAEAVVVD